MTGLPVWFAARSLRERRLILTMLGLLGVTIVWAGLIMPVRDGLSSTRARYIDAVVAVGDAGNAIDSLAALRADRAAPLGVPLAEAVRARAEQAGFTLATLEPDGERVRASIATARPGALFTWVSQLERAGILVDAISVTPNDGQTVAVQLTLRARGT